MKSLFYIFGSYLLISYSCFAHIGDHLISSPGAYKLHYTDNDPSDVLDYVAKSNADDTLDYYDRMPDGSPEVMAGLDMEFRSKFREPFWYLGPSIKMEDAKNASHNGWRIRIPPHLINQYGANHDYMVAIHVHELFHGSQFRYTGGNNSRINGLNPIGYEGTATVLMDMLYTYLDIQPSRQLENGFLHWTAHYLNNYTDLNLWNTGNEYDGYPSSLFWRYLCDQYGSSTNTTPNDGIDFIQAFWEAVENGDMGTSATLQSVIDKKDRVTTSAIDKGISLEELYQDFSIACWLRRYKNNYVNPMYQIIGDDIERYYFLDENEYWAPFYGARNVDTDEWVDNSNPDDDVPNPTENYILNPNDRSVPVTREINRWATHYVVCDLGLPNFNQYGIGFWAESNTDQKCVYTLVGIRMNGSAEILQKGGTDIEGGNKFHYARMQETVNPYVKLVAIINGQEGSSSSTTSGGSEYSLRSSTIGYSSYFAYFEPEMEILEPQASIPAYVGSDFDNPERFLLKLRITTPDDFEPDSVIGMDSDDLSIYVGSMVSSNKADILNMQNIYGEYWLTVQAPINPDPSNSTQPLFVTLGSDIIRIEEQAIVYDDVNIDQVLLIDRSGSMNKQSGGISRMTAARAAAQLYIDSAGSDDLLGIAQFYGDGNNPGNLSENWDDATMGLPLGSMSSQIIRDLACLYVDENNPANPFIPSGRTSIGDGLYIAASNLVNYGRASAQKSIILLSDGHQNEPTNINDQLGSLVMNNIKVYTIALGPHCDESKLEMLANDTGGRYYKIEADEDTSSPMPLKLGMPSTMTEYLMMKNLADVYLSVNEEITKKSRLIDNSYQIELGQTVSVSYEVAPGGLKDARICAFHSLANANLDLTVTDPDGVVYPIPSSGSNKYDPEHHIVYRIDEMKNGVWTFDLTSNESNLLDISFYLSAKNVQGAQANIRISQDHDKASLKGYKLIGLPVNIRASLCDSLGYISNANVNATISHPNKDDVSIPLKDNGNGFDNLNNDGIYGAQYRATTEGTVHGSYDENGPEIDNTGSYTVDVTIQGVDNFGRSFSINEKEYFNIYIDGEGGFFDTDLDGIADNYEELYESLNPAVADAQSDNDGDGLSNYNEYQIGTLPNNGDSDGGGENDGSEINRGSNPFDSSDDTISSISDIRILTRLQGIERDGLIQPNRNIIVIPFEEGFDKIELWRTSDTNSISGIPFSYIGNLTSTSNGVYIDDNLTNYTTYYYKALPVGVASQTGTWSRIISGVPKADPIVPEVRISINGQDSVIDPFVDLNIYASDDVTEMQLSLNPDFSGSLWIPFQNNIQNYSLGSPSPETLKSVYLKVKDADDNYSSASTSVNIMNPALYGTIEGTIEQSLDYSDANSRIEFIGLVETNSICSQSDGTFSSILLDGEYNIVITQRGYETYLISNVIVTAGNTTSLGSTISLQSLDSDGDGVKDVIELRDYESSITESDTDTDGFDDYTEIYVTRTDPTNSSSLLKIENFERLESSNVVSWNTVSNVIYQIYSSYDLERNLNEWDLKNTHYSSNSMFEVWAEEDTLGTNNKLFYKIIVPENEDI